MSTVSTHSDLMTLGDVCEYVTETMPVSPGTKRVRNWLRDWELQNLVSPPVRVNKITILGWRRSEIEAVVRKILEG